MDSLRGILEASPDAVLIVGENGVIQQANRNVGEILGYAPSELEGMVVEDLLLEEDREHHVQFRQEYMDDPEPRPMGRELDLYALHKDGTNVPVEISLGPIQQDGKLAVVATISDISNRKQREQELQASEQRYRRLLEVSPAPIVIYNTEGTILYANDTAAETMNMASADGLTGLSALDLVHPDERDAARAKMRQALEEGESVKNIERTLRTPEGEIRYAILSTTPIQYEDEPAAQVVVNDVTELKERERHLQRQNERLEEFASIVSHDLRNPLNVAEGRLQLAQEEVDSEHLEAIERSLDRMDVLIEDLLTLAREGEPVQDLMAVDLAATVESCWRNVETVNATLVTDTERTIRADQGRLQQLLENLIRNAVEHGGTDVTVTVGELDDGFYLEDDGPGIPTDQRNQVFQRGYSTSPDGTGFGLAIVRRIVEAHDWMIQVTEGNHGGARFEITDIEFMNT